MQYLLGLCSQADRECIESEYFEDEDAFQKMLAAEDDLIDAYARGDLTNEERRRFEKHFLRSSRGRKRVQFARAFTVPLPGTRPPETSRHVEVFDILRSFQGWRGALRVATVAGVIAVVVVLSWLLLERGRMRDELRELRAQYAELSKETEALRVHADEPKQRNAGTADIEQVNRAPVPKEKKSVSEKTASRRPKLVDTPLINTQDATLGSTFVNKQITQLPLEAPKVPSLLTLQPATTRQGYVAGQRSDQANITLDGVDITQGENSLTLTPGSRRNTIQVANSTGWIRLQLRLETHAQHTEYRINIKAADGRPITTVDWIEPLTPNQNTIDTPVIPTVDLPLGDYQLTLMGKEPDGSFVRVAQYSFKIIRN